MTEDWSQPDFYRFNQDSLALVNWIIDQSFKANSILDLGCGCGIIGIELARRLNPISLTLVELQAEFLPHLASNLQRYLPQTVEVKTHISSFGQFQNKERYELIVCNPPYYLPEHGELSRNLHRARCRSFLVDGWEILSRTIRNHLARGGQAVLIVPIDPVTLKHVSEIVAKQDFKLETAVAGRVQILQLTVA